MARYNPWIVPTQPEGTTGEVCEGGNSGRQLPGDSGQSDGHGKDVLQNRGNSKLLSYKADVYEEPGMDLGGAVPGLCDRGR